MNSFLKLSKYHHEIFAQIDMFLFNSSISQQVFERHLTETNGTVVPITHSDIKDHRIERTFSCDNLRLGFIGNTTPYKGYPLLENTLIELLNEGHKSWSLDVWGGIKAEHQFCTNISFRGKYSSHQLREVFESMDLLIVPSIWQETFSLITLEALSYGLPVLVSSTVGAKDIIKQYNENFIFGTKDDLKNVLKQCFATPNILNDFNQEILNSEWVYSQKKHVENIRSIYENIRQQKR